MDGMEVSEVLVVLMDPEFGRVFFRAGRKFVSVYLYSEVESGRRL